MPKNTQKNTTKRKKNRRSKRKYPALEKGYNLSLKQDYIELEYIDGVKNEDNEVVIRALNNEEKEWLNKFNEEVVNANFVYDAEIKETYNEIKKLKDHLKTQKKPTKEELEELDRLHLKRWERESEVLLHKTDKQRKKLYGENNARNRCLYNRSKSAGNLFSIEDSTYDNEKDSHKTYVSKEDGIILKKPGKTDGNSK